MLNSTPNCTKRQLYYSSQLFYFYSIANVIYFYEFSNCPIDLVLCPGLFDLNHLI